MLYALWKFLSTCSVLCLQEQTLSKILNPSTDTLASSAQTDEIMLT